MLDMVLLLLAEYPGPPNLGKPDMRKEKALKHRRLCQRSNELFPVPLACLCRGNEGVFVVGIHDARVSSDIRSSQKLLAAFVGSNGLEMSESIPHKIDRGAFHRQGLCACVGETDGGRVRMQ